MDTFKDPAKPVNEPEELVTKGNLVKGTQEEEDILNDGESNRKDSKFRAMQSGLEVKGKALCASSIYPVTKVAEDKVIFKKPIVIMGPIRGKATGKLQGNVQGKNSTSSIPSKVDKPGSLKSGPSCQNVKPSKEMDPNLLAPIPYSEPSWSGYPSRVYGFEIIKGGQLIENFDLSTRAYHAIGRSPINDVVLLHPTMSRFHAVIQFRDDEKGTPDNPPGMYIYDMGSTHGTFLNKSRIKPRMYVRVHVGHFLKFGSSSRNFLLKGPLEDQEDESVLTVTQIQNQRSNELIRRELEVLKGKVPDQEQGISWGMDDDADEETDLSINPFASSNNEELYIDDPKKTLRGWFEREGHELVYSVEEKSPGHFRCCVDVPLESCPGGRHVAEATVQGKKKEAVLQCALEACRVLDQYGLLRQATHESKKRKAKDWEAEDYYDSDDDTFLDRTGVIEQKRKARIAASSVVKQTLSYSELLVKHQEIRENLERDEEMLSGLNRTQTVSMPVEERPDRDELDEYMDSLGKGAEKRDKASISMLKIRIKNLKAEYEMNRRLLEKASPSYTSHMLSQEQRKLAPPPPSPKGHNVTVEKTSSWHKLPQLKKSRTISKKIEGNDLGFDRSTGKKILGDNLPKELNMNIEEEIESDISDESSGCGSSGYGTCSGKGQENGLADVETKLPTKPANENVQSTKIGAVGDEKIPISDNKQSDGEDETPADEQDEGQDGGEDQGVVTKKRRTRTRINRRPYKSQEKQSQYSSASDSRGLYSNWTPPQGQSGDGRTSLNDKLGY